MIESAPVFREVEKSNIRVEDEEEDGDDTVEHMNIEIHALCLEPNWLKTTYFLQLP
jgi:hypothetical protein